MKKKNVRIGCIADDFTGASDVCSFLLMEAKCLLINDVPKTKIDTDANVIVIALKIRSVSKDVAIEKVKEAIDWLESMGVDHFYDKYCSTFDSTSEGNIGPILDYLLDRLNLTYTLVSPALPQNQREVFNGLLFADGKLLEEGSMRNHPITPMKDSNLVRLLNAQSKYKSYSLNHRVLYHQQFDLMQFKQQYIRDEKFYLIPDYYEEQHGRKLMKFFSKMQLLSGSSALIFDWYKALNGEGTKKIEYQSKEDNSKALILSGSLSNQTKSQIDDYRNLGNLILIDTNRLSCDYTDQLLKKVQENPDSTLIYSERQQTHMKAREVAKKLEETFADLAAKYINQGGKKIIVAGGETSGAVIQALPFKAYIATKNVAPGVPILRPVDHEEIQIILKSGNFGQKDFFERAINLMKGK
ncbi:four-carbon acid sugar kinase family protein [Peptoniphilaceae bacterium SGI.137]|nr:four-carbon acid sugar kinase family protein [Peptoniphilaceae bacterium]